MSGCLSAKTSIFISFPRRWESSTLPYKTSYTCFMKEYVEIEIFMFFVKEFYFWIPAFAGMTEAK